MSARSWKQVAIPERMAILPKDRRGYPVPVILAYDSTGTPKFQINDDRKVEWCLAQHTCAICGQAMHPFDRWMVGGPLSAFHEYGAYIDTPTHKLCLEYALQVCPYLVHNNYRNRIDLDGVAPAEYGMSYFLDPTQDEERVPFFVAVLPESYQIIRREGNVRVLKPKKPYREFQFWSDGRRLTDYEARFIYWAHQADPVRKPHQILSIPYFDELP